MKHERIPSMTKAGEMLGDVLEQTIKQVRPGISELELDAFATKLIKEKGGEVAFAKVPGYKHATCISTNDVVVHGIPTKRVLDVGDIIGIDCGVYLNGYYTDMAETVIALNDEFKASSEIEKFLSIGKQGMFAGIYQAKPGNHVGHISKAIQDIVEGNGYSIVRGLVGHGVGEELHMDPEIPGYVERPLEKTPVLKVGQTIAIEVIYNMGKKEVMYANNDDWTISTEDGELSGLFERTVLITEHGPRLITAFSTDPSDLLLTHKQ